jgi:hypothetical protein
MALAGLYDPKWTPCIEVAKFVKISVLCVNPLSPSFLQKFYLCKTNLNYVTRNLEEARLIRADQVEKYKKQYKYLGLLTVVQL